ncbi:hypothetical protein ACWDYH_35860 [Nocardia goodfellowii]
MVSGVEQVMVSSEVWYDGQLVVVTAGVPQSLSCPGEVGYLCRLRIDGLDSGPVAVESIASAPAGALSCGLARVSRELSISLTDLLADARIGRVDVATRADRVSAVLNPGRPPAVLRVRAT